MLPDLDENLKTYQALLEKWQARINLVSPDTFGEARIRHFEDSLQLLPYLSQEPFNLADLGTGAGFPGLVIAMARPDIKVTLVESDQRKCAFLKAVSRETKCKNVEIVNGRIEAVLPGIAPPPTCITARALSSLVKLFDYCYPLVEANPKMHFLFLKGRNAETEISEACAEYNFSCEKHTSVTSTESYILAISSLSKK
jgi:16S rRNA (guanine527-N7)-methyltransferase